ncbi:uncharacterized protein LOC143803948 [Ranitomeya variabilis]|uniref:uncharacterized protein LOC143803948 n=1 Tax=Ranitomeya variabilis TaxID=490064 RepID=UPI004057BFA0
MDYKNRAATWQVQAAQVFESDAANLMTGAQGDGSALQIQIKRLLHKRTRMWWNRALLENYLKKKIIPRGLRIQVFPSFPVSDETFITKWEEICTKSSLQFMELLVDLNKKSVLAVEVEIDDWFGSLKEISTVDNLATFNTTMDKNSDEWEKQIKSNQAKKILRDNNDYQHGTVYRWRHQGSRRQRSVSFSSVSSSGETSDTSYHSMRTRFGNENKRKKEQKSGTNKRTPGSNPSNDSLKVINLSNHVFNNEEILVLSKGLTFSPSTRCDKFTVIKDLHVFGRSLLFKKWYHSEEIQKLFPLPSEQAALKTLEELAIEHQGPSLGTTTEDFMESRREAHYYYRSTRHLTGQGSPNFYIIPLTQGSQEPAGSPSYHQVEFLDVLVRRGPDGLLSSDAFRKVTAVNSVLHASSSHPPHVVNAVPMGQFLRIKRICSDSLDFEARAKEMKTRFLERGYSKRSIKRAYNIARNMDRNHLLYSSNKKESTNQKFSAMAALMANNEFVVPSGGPYMNATDTWFMDYMIFIALCTLL